MSMTPEERIAIMTKAINQAIKVMGDRFGSTEEDVARASQGLKASMQWFGDAPMSLVVGSIGFMCTPLLSPGTSQPTD